MKQSVSIRYAQVGDCGPSRRQASLPTGMRLSSGTAPVSDACVHNTTCGTTVRRRLHSCFLFVCARCPGPSAFTGRLQLSSASGPPQHHMGAAPLRAAVVHDGRGRGAVPLRQVPRRAVLQPGAPSRGLGASQGRVRAPGLLPPHRPCVQAVGGAVGAPHRLRHAAGPARGHEAGVRHLRSDQAPDAHALLR